MDISAQTEQETQENENTEPVQSGEGQQKDSEQIELDFDVLTQNSSANSLQDLYGYDVFSESFSGKVNIYQQQLQEKREEAFRNVFTQQGTTKNDEIFSQVINAEVPVVVKTKTNSRTNSESPAYFAVGCVFFGILVTVGIWLIIQKLKKGRKKNH